MKTMIATLGALSLLSACNDSQSVLPGSATFFVSDASIDIPTCISTSADKKMQPGLDGAEWHWTKTDHASGLLFCQKTADGQTSAWREVEADGKATHSLQFSSSKTLFQPI